MGFQAEALEGGETLGVGGNEEGNGRVVQRDGIGIGHGMNSRFKGAQSRQGRGSGVLGDTCGGPEERAVFHEKGGKLRKTRG
jgi:hypothetical protein